MKRFGAQAYVAYTDTEVVTMSATTPTPMLGDAIAYMRGRRGLSQRRLSQLAGLSPSYVQKVERGEVVPSLRTFARLAVVLHLNRNEIYVLVQSECAPTTGEHETQP